MPKVTRRQALAAGSIACAPAVQIRGAQRTGRPKNILFLLSDQHKPDVLGIEGHRVARTPNLDAFAREGVRFASAYCANPVCTPSRASLLTGLYTHRHQTWNNSTPWPFEHKTMAHYFSRAGYMTALVGKMHFVDAQTHGFDYRLDFNDWFQYLGPKTKLYADELSRRNSGSGNPQIDDLWRDYDDPWIGVRELDDRKGPVHVGRPSKLIERDHFENFVARESIRFLKNHSKRQPFLLISSFLKPHDPFMPAQRFADMFKPADMTLPDTWGKVDLNTVPQDVKETILHNRPTPELKDEEAAKQRIAMYHGSLTHLDDCCGQVLRALKDQGLEDDTIVLYSSDHGEMLAEHGMWQKFMFYEASVGVPLIFRVPGLTSHGARCETPVSLTQIVATLCELAGVAVPSNLDGESFVPCLREPSRKLDKTVFSEFALQTPHAKYMIRRGDYKYNFYANDIAELFSLRDDPKEMNNLALKPEHRSRVDELKSQLFAWYRPPEIGMRVRRD
jgi:choline-sulfatase